MTSSDALLISRWKKPYYEFRHETSHFRLEIFMHINNNKQILLNIISVHKYPTKKCTQKFVCIQLWVQIALHKHPQWHLFIQVWLVDIRWDDVHTKSANIFEAAENDANHLRNTYNKSCE